MVYWTQKSSINPEEIARGSRAGRSPLRPSEGHRQA